jgi:hypothetical protein
VRLPVRGDIAAAGGPEFSQALFERLDYTCKFTSMGRRTDQALVVGIDLAPVQLSIDRLDECSRFRQLVTRSLKDGQQTSN